MADPYGAGYAAPRRRSSGGFFAVFNMFPKMAIPMIVYAIMAYTAGRDFVENHDLLRLPMMSDAVWNITAGDLVLILGLVFLFIEVIKSSHTGSSSVVNHATSLVVFIVALILFLLVGRFATSVFFLLMLMALLDTVAGFIVSIVSARRDLAVGDA